MFQSEKDFQAPILHILSEMPGGSATRQDIFAAFESRYGDQILPEHREQVGSTARIIKWHNFLSWSRQHLIDDGYLDSPERGVWRLTEKGRKWVMDNPHATHIAELRRRPGSSQRKRKPKERNGRLQTPPGLSLDMLEKTKEVMGDEQFDQVWGPIYQQLLAEERARAITEISDSNLARTARQQVRQIQDYLQGHSANRPSGEQLCDWIHFCYQFSLFREAAALYTLVNPDEVNSWYLERTRKIALTSRSRR